MTTSPTAARTRLEDRILDDLRTVARELGTDSLTVRLYNRHRSDLMLPASTVRDHLGSWSHACLAAGLRPHDQAPEGRSDQEILEGIRRTAAHLGVQEISYDAYNRARVPGAVTSAGVVRRFGSWASACAAADLRPVRLSGGGARAKSRTDEQVIQDVRTVAAMLGLTELPRAVYDRCRDRVWMLHGVTLERRFGSWTEVCRLAGLATGPNCRHRAHQRSARHTT